jgi:septal ring factor EnvC (AmiA/AmiB activator)
VSWPDRLRVSFTTVLSVCLVLSGLSASSSAEAQSAEQKLQRIEREIRSSLQQEQNLETKADRLNQGLKLMRGNLIDTAASVQTQEEKVSNIEIKLKALSTEERAKARDLGNRHGELSSIIGSLARLGRRPSEALISAPTAPIDAVRSVIVLTSIIPELQLRTDNLRAELAALRGVRQDISGERAALASASETLFRERQALDRLLTQTSRLHKQTLNKKAQSKQRIARLAQKAQNLRALLRELQKEEKRLARESPDTSAIPSGKAFSTTHGHLPLPVRGRLVTQFGERNQFGTRNRGLGVATRSQAQVVAPYDGRVLFAGPFRTYGQLLIISHGEGYHSLIAGMSRIDSAVGQWLLAGEPIGRMGRNDGSAPVLYLELRRNGAPINPLPWLAANERKVSG